MRCKLDRREQEKKRNQKVDFVSMWTQPGMVTTAPKISMPLTGSRTFMLTFAKFLILQLCLYKRHWPMDPVFC